MSGDRPVCTAPGGRRGSMGEPARGNPDAHDRTRRPRGDDGRAIIEVTFLAVLLLIPTLYAILAILSLQSATLAVAQAARDVGRLIETAEGSPTAAEAHDVAAVALRDHAVPAEGFVIRTVAPGADCLDGPEITATRTAGIRYLVCVIATVSLPGVPTAVTGSNNTVTGVYLVTLGPLREGT